MKVSPKPSPSLIYHYIYRACIRCQVACGATAGRYVQWKARLPLIALESAVALTAIAWIEVLVGHDYIFYRQSFIRVIMLVGIVLYIDQRLFSSKDTSEAYAEIFRAWPPEKQKKWDRGVIVAAILAPVFVMLIAGYAGMLLKGILNK
jgi:hypothetical protein